MWGDKKQKDREDKGKRRDKEGKGDYYYCPKGGKDSKGPRGPPRGIDPGVGDWLCPNAECGNWNWAKRNECCKCFTPHPTRKPDKHQTYADKLQDQRAGLDTGRKFATGHGDRAGHSGGYKEVDQEALYRQKRRREEDQFEKDQRKAAKTRCASCKRYSCVC